MTENFTIGKTIATLRKDKGWTQAELAEKLNVSDKAISKWESEAGFPEISQFPVLAKVFDVSIDYLMTGKDPDKEVITISQIELCAKNDDVDLFKALSDQVIQRKDDSQHDIVYYISQYNSAKVFDALIEKYGVKALVESYMSRHSLRYDVREVIELLIRFEKLKELVSIGFFAYSTHSNELNNLYHIGMYLDFIVNKISVKNSIVEHIISLYKNSPIDQFNDWIALYSAILKFAFNNKNTEYINLFLSVIIQANKDFILKHKNSLGVHKTAVVHVDSAVVRYLIEQGRIEDAQFLNKICSKKVPSGEFELYLKRASGAVSEYEAAILPCVRDGMIDLEKLFACGNYDLIKQALNEYAVHSLELFCRYFKLPNKRKFFEYAVDAERDDLVNCVVNNEFEKCEKRLVELGHNWGNRRDEKGIYTINSSYKYLGLCPENHLHIPYFKSVDEILAFFDDFKQKQLEKIKPNYEKQIVLKELTKQYFTDELQKNSIDIVIIKLCVRLEAILKSYYEGTFEEMLNKYCSDGRCDSEMKSLLNKLRKQRNAIVHAESKTENMSVDELNKCVDYVCSLN